LRIDTRQSLVQPLGNDTDLGAVRQFGHTPLDRRDVVVSRHDAQPAFADEPLDRGEARPDLVEKIQDLTLLVSVQTRSAGEHCPHPLESGW
jgi:hypothetical protein